jgi:hypothetical protein
LIAGKIIGRQYKCAQGQIDRLVTKMFLNNHNS